MSNKNKIAFYGIVGLCVLLFCLLLSECNRSSNLKEEAESISAFYEAEKNQQISRDSIQAQVMIDMQQNLMTEQSARVLLEKEFERFKSIQSHVRFESITKVETLRVEYQGPPTDILADYDDFIPIDSVRKHFLQVPRDLVHTEEWFQFYGTVDHDHFMIDSLSFINKFDVTIGTKKSDKFMAFMRKKEYTVELVSYSPYSSVNYVNNIVVEDDKSKLVTPVSFGLGAATTFLIFKLIQ